MYAKQCVQIPVANGGLNARAHKCYRLYMFAPDSTSKWKRNSILILLRCSSACSRCYGLVMAFADQPTRKCLAIMLIIQDRSPPVTLTLLFFHCWGVLMTEGLLICLLFASRFLCFDTTVCLSKGGQGPRCSKALNLLLKCF